MNLIYSEQLTRDKKEGAIFYASRNISEVFSVYAIDNTIVPLGVVQWNGRQVTIDCADIPVGIPVYITYFTDNYQHSADIIPLGRMVEEVFNKFGGRNNCKMSDRFIKEKLIYHINYLNRTKINQYYNKQFCFQKVVDEFKTCACIETDCCGCSGEEIKQIKWSCGCSGECHDEGCEIDDVVEEKLEPKFKIPKNAPHSGYIRLKSGEYVEYTNNNGEVQLNGQHNINKLGDFTIGYWIPTNDVISVSIDGKPTSKYDLYDQHIFLRDEQSCNVCIEYVEKYSECNIDDLCVVFDNSFWKLPVYETIVELAVDSDDTRVNAWSQQLQQMKKEYTIIISKTNMEFSQKLDKITNIKRKYNSRLNMSPTRRFEPPNEISFICKSCK